MHIQVAGSYKRRFHGIAAILYMYTAMCGGERKRNPRPLPLYTMLDMVSNKNAVYFKMAGGKKEEQRRAITV